MVNCFKFGFDIGYRGSVNVKRRAPNLKFRIGNELILWNKVIKEVKEKRFAGPFKEIPYEFYIQSPIGLVLKDNGKDARLIFHLSYPRNGKSLNSETPPELCSVHYPDFAEAIRRCLNESSIFGHCVIAKSDMKSAFRNLGIKPQQWAFLSMMARSPIDGQWYFFLDKCLPFGASISCSHFQRFSNSVSHIVKVKSGGKIPINYLDDYFFADMLKTLCDAQVQLFLDVCKTINFPVSMEKTFWGTTALTFLGLLIDTVSRSVSIPLDKVYRVTILVEEVLESKKTTVKTLQRLCGFLNFLCRCIVPGRTFTRRLYSKFSSKMKPHYHISVTREMRSDLSLWKEFLSHPSAYCHPFIDYSTILQANDIDLYTDASGKLGCGGFFKNSWFQLAWIKDELLQFKPSIEYLELFAVTIAVTLWASKLANLRVCLFVDNKSMRDMINSMSSNCKNCMVLIRKIVMQRLIHNVRIFAKYVSTKDNYFADAILRFQHDRLHYLCKINGKDFDPYPVLVPDEFRVEILPY